MDRGSPVVDRCSPGAARSRFAKGPTSGTSRGLAASPWRLNLVASVAQSARFRNDVSIRATPPHGSAHDDLDGCGVWRDAHGKVGRRPRRTSHCNSVDVRVERDTGGGPAEPAASNSPICSIGNRRRVTGGAGSFHRIASTPPSLPPTSWLPAAPRLLPGLLLRARPTRRASRRGIPSGSRTLP